MKRSIKILMAALVLISTSYAQNDIESLIIGKWKGVSMIISCDSIKGFNEVMNYPLLQFYAKTKVTEYRNNKTFDRSDIMDPENNLSGKYEIVNKSIYRVYINKEGEERKSNWKINSITEDTLIVSIEGKSGDKEYAELLVTLNAKNDTDKIVVTTYKYRRYNGPELFIMLNPVIDKNKAEKLIIGHWKAVNLTMRSNDIRGFNELMEVALENITEMKTFKGKFGLKFNANKTYIENEGPEVINGKYYLDDNNINTTYKLMGEEVKQQLKIISITDDTLITLEEYKLGHPMFESLLEILNAQNDTDKLVFLIQSYCKSIDSEPALTMANNSFDRENAQRIIVGKWEVTNMTMRCDEINGFNKIMQEADNDPDYMRSLPPMSVKFKENKTYFETEGNGIIMGKYEMVDNEIIRTYTNRNKELKGHDKIISITEDTLIILREEKTSDSKNSWIPKAFNLSDDSDKKISVTYTYCKSKIINPPVINENFSYDKSKIEHLVIGQWKGSSLTVKCNESELLDELSNSPTMKSMLESVTQASLLELTSDKILIVGESDTNKYFVTGDSLNFIIEDNSFWSDDTLTKEKIQKFKVIYVSKDSLILRHSKNTSDPDVAMWFRMMSNADEVKNKILIYTTVYTRVKEARAPWTMIENNLSKEKEAVSLIAYDTKLLCVLKSPQFSFDDYDSIFLSIDEAKSWQSLNSTFPKVVNDNLEIACQDKIIFIATKSGIYYTYKIEQPFIKVNSINLTETFITPTSFKIDKSNIVVCNRDQLYLSNDNGTNWKQLKNAIQTESSEIYCVGLKDSFIIIGGMTENHKLILRYSKDNGETWSDSEEGFKEYMGIMPTSFLMLHNSIYMNTQYGWFISKDYGKSWEKSLSNMPGGTITLGGSLSDLSIAKTETCIFISNGDGVFLSSDNGSNWVEVNNKELKKGVNSIAILNSDIFALTSENKIWKASIAELVKYADESSK